jgi:hypothetical protein
LIYILNNPGVRLRHNNFLRNRRELSSNSLLYIFNGEITDQKNFFGRNVFYCLARTNSGGTIYLENSYVESNKFTTYQIGNVTIDLTSGSLISSPSFDIKCWVYNSFYSKDFKRAYVYEINLGPYYSSAPTPSKSPTSSCSISISQTPTLLRSIIISRSPTPSPSKSISSSPFPSLSRILSISRSPTASSNY